MGAAEQALIGLPAIAFTDHATSSRSIRASTASTSSATSMRWSDAGRNSEPRHSHRRELGEPLVSEGLAVLSAGKLDHVLGQFIACVWGI